MRGRDAEPEWIATRGEIVDSIRSGLFTGREVMDRLGISSGILGGWCRAEQMRRSKGAAPASRPAFAEVSLVGPARRAGAVVLLRGGRRLLVREGFEAAEVVRLVRALESC